MSTQQLGYDWFPNKAHTTIHVLEEMVNNFWYACCGCTIASEIKELRPLNDKKHELLRCKRCLWILRKRHNL